MKFKFSKKISLTLFLASLFLGSAASAFAPGELLDKTSNASLVVRRSDTGAGIVGAHVCFTDDGGHQECRDADGNGFVNFGIVSVSFYILDITANGYQSYRNAYFQDDDRMGEIRLVPNGIQTTPAPTSSPTAPPSTATITGINLSSKSISLGSSITWTAQAISSGGAIDYKFDVYNFTTKTWVQTGSYSSQNTLSFVPVTAGQFYTQVWVRNTGTSVAYQDWENSEITTVVVSPATITSVNQNVGPTVVTGTPIVWTVSSAPSTGVEYKFDIYNQNSLTWIYSGAYGPSNSHSFTPAVPATYHTQVQVRRVGSAATYEAWKNSASINVVQNKATLTSVTTSSGASIGRNLPITWTATASSPTGTIEYKFDVYNQTNSTWVYWGTYSSNKFLTYTPASIGSYHVQVRVRVKGSIAPYDDWKNSGTILVGP